MAKHNESKEARSYAFGGFFGKSNMESKPKKINLNDKQVRLNSGEYVQVLDLGRKYGYTIDNVVFVKYENMEKSLLELYAIRGMEFKTESPFG